MSDSLCESVPSKHRMSSQRTQLANGSEPHTSIKKAVVVLTRLDECKINALRPPTPQQFYSEDDLLSSSDSDMERKPEGESSDSDYSPANKKQKPSKSNGVTKKSQAAKPPALPTSSCDNNNSGKATNTNTMT